MRGDAPVCGPFRAGKRAAARWRRAVGRRGCGLRGTARDGRGPRGCRSPAERGSGIRKQKGVVMGELWVNYAELADAIGEDGAEKLCRAVGGVSTYIPRTQPEGSPLCGVIGTERMRRLCSAFGGLRVTLPNRRRSEPSKVRIARLLESGKAPGGRRPRNRRHGTVCAHDCQPLQDRERRKRRAGFGMPPGLRRGRARPALSAARFNRSPFRQAWLAGLGGGRGASQRPVRGVWEVSAATPETSQGSPSREARGGSYWRRDPVIGSDRCPSAGRCPFLFLADPRRGASFPRAWT